jgi:hypothetical protein
MPSNEPRTLIWVATISKYQDLLTGSNNGLDHDCGCSEEGSHGNEDQSKLKDKTA